MTRRARHREEPTARQRLESLADEPDKQAALAMEIVEDGSPFDAVAALALLRDRADAEFRPRLWAVYEYLAADGIRRDAGGIVRVALLRALAPIVVASDAPRLEAAARTVELTPPGPKDVAAGIRGAALVALVSVDHERAGLSAVRLLHDLETDRMSGEPAATAARVLRALEERLPLYAYVLGTPHRVPEVTAECLPALGRLDTSLVEDLFDRFEGAGSAEPTEWAALYELAVEHEDVDRLVPRLATALDAAEDPDLLLYLATLMIGRRRPALLAAVLHAAQWEMKGPRASIYREALELRAGDPDVDAMMDVLDKRLSALAGRG
jgi:hypothetical protein